MGPSANWLALSTALKLLAVKAVMEAVSLVNIALSSADHVLLPKGVYVRIKLVSNLLRVLSIKPLFRGNFQLVGTFVLGR